jgi:UDP-N-acetylglucosamine--N-acetylmuramyl-(pentapeptide) pyrophosphoryl-undecaprenol N-acetylglucosamine transferase
MKQKETINILVAAGGTGGHLFPALAVAKEIEKTSDKKVKLFFTGRPDKIEAEKIPAMGYPFIPMNISGLVKKFSFATLALPFKILCSTRKIKKLIKKEKIDAVIAAGAYISYPPGIASSITRTPLFLLEANVNPGKTIMSLANKARFIFTSYEESKKYFPFETQSKIIHTGNPIRDNILVMPEQGKAKEELGFDRERKMVFVFGGSLGAKSINQAMLKYLNNLAESGLNILWQTGKNFEAPKLIPKNIKVVEFVDDMNIAYSASDLLVCRSGGTTVAEIAAIGKPSILVPLSTASNNEQAHNAKALMENNAAIMLNDKEVGDKLFSELMSLINDDTKLANMSSRARSLGRPFAAKECANIILKAVSGS